MAVLRTAVLALAATRVVSDASYDPIGGYTPGSDVIEHSEIDLDMVDLKAYVNYEDATTFNWTRAYQIYNNGNHSLKSSGTRTLRGFSTDYTKMVGETTFDIYQSYWSSGTYADDIVMAALDGTGDYAGAADVTRQEVVQKVVAYQNVWMYVLHELYDAVGDCTASSIADNDAGVHAWDEGWAFYAGSLTGENGYPEDGKLMYELANKRCNNYGTCANAGTGNSAVNSALLTLFEEGRDYLTSGECDSASDLIPSMVSLMTVPLVQGTLRYAYKSDSAVTTAVTDKSVAEGWAFASAVLPLVDNCDSNAATVVYDNMYVGASQPVVDGYAAVKTALESVYTCLGISCADVGGLVSAWASDDDGAAPETYYFDACTDSPTSAPTQVVVNAGARTVSGITALAGLMFASVAAFF